VRSQQPDGQLQQQHNIQAKITMYNKQDKSEVATDTKKYTLLIRAPYNDELITVSDLTERKNLLS
jgi:hypothetical protein